MVGRGPLARLAGLVHLARGALSAWRLAGREMPAAVLVTGGYVCVPVAVGAWLRRRPLAIYLPDVRPGRAVALLARLASVIAVTAPAAGAFLPAGKARVTGYPVRPELRRADRAAARRELGLAEDDRLVLAFGGSQGARRVNEAVAGALPLLPPRAVLLHVCGPAAYDDLRARREAMPESLRRRYHLHPYLESRAMADALAAADLAVCRAGAAVLGELPAMGLPAILVPLPISGGHQWPNARALAEAGAAHILADEACRPAELAELVGALLADDGARAAMSLASRGLDRPTAARDIWALVQGLGQGAHP
jgi:UDP-N-acetylglucosamine--N-acetylmuramyl-(pentapeptide) pyrophosphoryl-undecaprenol N-acetylglucosamine transferase